VSNKRIAIITNSSWNIYNFRLDLIRELSERNYKVVVIAPLDEYTQKIIDKKIEFVELKHLKRNGTNPFKDIRLLIELIGIFIRLKIEFALLYTIKPNIYGSLAGHFCRVKTIATITGLGYSFLNNGISNIISTKLYRLALHNIDKVIFQNQDDMNLFINERLVSKNKAKLISGSGVDLNNFVSQPVCSSATFNFIFVGRLLKDKGIIEFIQAAEIVLQKYKNVSFSIVGEIDIENPAALDVNFLKSKLNLFPAIKYFGKLNDIRPLVNISNVFVLPSYREGLPKSTLEALAMGKPIITTDVPGCRETVIENINGHLVEAKNILELFCAMEKMLLYPKERLLGMGIASRKLAEDKFSVTIIVNEYLKLLATL